MPLNDEFDTNLRKIIATSIPCVHMNTLLISERVLNTFKKYLNECKQNGLTTIDDILENMLNKNEQSRDQ